MQDLVSALYSAAADSKGAYFAGHELYSMNQEACNTLGPGGCNAPGMEGLDPANGHLYVNSGGTAGYYSRAGSRPTTCCSPVRVCGSLVTALMAAARAAASADWQASASCHTPNAPSWTPALSLASRRNPLNYHQRAPRPSAHPFDTGQHPAQYGHTLVAESSTRSSVAATWQRLCSGGWRPRAGIV
jgi:hypothetical protein